MILRSEISGQFSSGHQIEHALESAVKTPEGRSCPLLWRLYLRCCALVRPKGLKDLVYKAINSCPGAKVIDVSNIHDYMLLCSKLLNYLSFSNELTQGPSSMLYTNYYFRG